MQQYFYAGEFEGSTDSQRIAACLAAAKAAGPNAVAVLNGRDFIIDEAILLSSDMTVLIDDCAVIQADGTFDNVFRGDNLVLNEGAPWGEAEEVLPLRNVRIVGRGNARIIGCEHNRRAWHPVLQEEQEMLGDYWGWRAVQLLLVNANGFEVSGLSFTRTRSWACLFDWCSNGHVHHIDVRSDVKNGDGLHFLSGCHHLLIEDITGCTSDDTVAIQTGWQQGCFPYRNYLYPMTPAWKLNCERPLRDWDSHDITVRNVCAGGRYHNVMCLALNDTAIYNVTYENISDTPPLNELYFATVFLYTGIYGRPGTLRNITVRGVDSLARAAVVVNTDIDGLTLSGLKQNNPDGKLINTWKHQ